MSAIETSNHSRPSIQCAERPLRIAHIVDSLEPGGMENGIINVATGLGAGGFDFHVICLTKRGQFANRMPYPCQVVALGKEPGFSSKWAQELRRALGRMRPDVIHTHNLGPLIYVGIAGLHGGLPPIAHGEHAELDPGEREWKRLLLRRWLYRRCRIVQTVSESLSRNLLDNGLRHPHMVSIPNGVDTSRFRPVVDRTFVRESLGLPGPGRGFVIGMVGRFGPYKRQALLVKAFELLAQRHRDARLVLVGDGGPEAIPVRGLVAASPYRERIVLAGFQAEPAPWYQAFDLMVLPSINEGMSNAVLEAMACGTPVLANASCGCAELIEDGETGFLRQFADADELAAILDAFVTNPAGAWTLSGARARALIEDRYSLRAMVDGYRAIYEQCHRIRRNRPSIQTAAHR